MNFPKWLKKDRILGTLGIFAGILLVGFPLWVPFFIYFYMIINPLPAGLLGESSPEIRSEVTSPDGAHIATWYDLLTPATDPFYSRVVIRPASEEFRNAECSDAEYQIFLEEEKLEKREKFREEIIGDVLVLDLEWKHQIDLVWETSKSLTIIFRCDEPDEHIRTREPIWRDVAITYKILGGIPLQEEMTGSAEPGS